ncbi:MAG: HisA/HisF-related TIM barrel protein [Hyphomicrobium sp.]|jgi:phosphoribosylformimino-5-aminoimidazole carboxamide ribotide isomerase
MDVIPVIDVRHAVAVAAVRGERAAYRPLETPLAEGSDPVAVARGYAALFTFPFLYVADLDGIEGRGRNRELPEALIAALPGVGLWIDDGMLVAEAPNGIAQGCDTKQVIGTESLGGDDDVRALRALGPDNYVLSLDFRADGFVGPLMVLDEPQYWPQKLIAMTLGRVGSGEGPDLQRVAAIIAQAGGRSVYAAGGVRNRADIEALHSVGAAGVLVATALHRGKIKAGDLKEIAGL